MAAGNDLDPPNEFLYTKKQISRLCGSLVTVTRDNEIIQIIQLSTREFLTNNDCMAARESASPIASFHINVPSAEAKMCAASLSSPAQRPLSQYEDLESSSRDSEIARIKTEYPLFEYAVLYWPEYLIHPMKEELLSHQTTNNLENAIHYLTTENSLLWLEDYLRQAGPEFLLYTTQQFRKYFPTAPRLHLWVDAVMTLLEEFAGTLSRKPQAVNLCFKSRVRSKSRFEVCNEWNDFKNPNRFTKRPRWLTQVIFSTLKQGSEFGSTLIKEHTMCTCYQKCRMTFV